MKNTFLLLFLFSIFPSFSFAIPHEKKCGNTSKFPCECVLKNGKSMGSIIIPCFVGYEDYCYPQIEKLPKACAKKYKGHEKDYDSNPNQCPTTCL